MLVSLSLLCLWYLWFGWFSKYWVSHKSTLTKIHEFGVKLSWMRNSDLQSLLNGWALCSSTLFSSRCSNSKITMCMILLQWQALFLLMLYLLFSFLLCSISLTELCHFSENTQNYHRIWKLPLTFCCRRNNTTN